MLVNYSGWLGEFQYDDEEFREETIKTDHGDLDALHYIGNGSYVEIPEGCRDYTGMSYGVVFPDGFEFEYIKDRGVTCMASMFEKAVMGKGFYLPNCEDWESDCVPLDFSECKDTSYMFAGAKFNEDFEFNSIPELWKEVKFGAGVNMNYMFAGAEFKNPNSLRGFNIRSRYGTIRGIFQNCIFPDGFWIPIDINVYDGLYFEDMSNMFDGTKFGKDFELRGIVDLNGESTNQFCENGFDIFSEETVLPDDIKQIAEILPERLRNEAILSMFCFGFFDSEDKLGYQVWSILDGFYLDDFDELTEYMNSDECFTRKEDALSISRAIYFQELNENVGLYSKGIANISDEDVDETVNWASDHIVKFRGLWVPGVKWLIEDWKEYINSQRG